MSAEKRRFSWSRTLVGLSLAAYLGLSLAVILSQRIGRVQGRWVAWAEDDAMVSMQVARQALDGHGLVWTVGEKVEAYSNLLWVLLMALCQALIPRDLAALGPLVVSLGLGVWGILATRRLALALGASEPAAALAAAGLALSHELIWATSSGLETVAMAAVLAEAWASLAEMRTGKRPWGLRPFTMAALAGLLRFDGLLFGALVLALGLGAAPRALRLRALAVALVPVLTAWLFRRSYYGAWMPNTVVLKAGAWDGRWEAGWRYLLRWRWEWALVGGAACSALRWRALWPWLFALLAITAYGLSTGGDFLPGTRYLAPAWPLIWALAAASLSAWAPRWSAGVMALCIAFSYNAALAWPGLMQSGKDAHLQRIQAAFDVQAHLQPGQSLAASWAGALYYFSDARGIDLLGKADPVVARAEADPWLGGTGHNKMDLDYSLGHRHPDWVLLLPPGTPHSGRFDQALAEHSLFRQQCRPEALLPDRAWKLYRCHW